MKWLRTWVLPSHSFLLVTGALAGLLAVAAPSSAEKAEVETESDDMILLSGGDFTMGHEGYQDFSPTHTVHLDPFYLDKYEVTNSQYHEFCQETGHRLPEFWGMDVYRSGPDYPDHPVVGVSWLDAAAYARWRGARLPTEAEWEYAARGGLVGKNYSHGDEPEENLYAKGGKTGDGGPSPVGQYPPNGYGLHDMTGNVMEWVKDWYDPDYYHTGPSENPRGPDHGNFRGVRGGGWHTGPYCRRVYIRTGLQSNWVDFNVGFRCARYRGTSAAREIGRIIEESGVKSALRACADMRTAAAGEYYFDEDELNMLGYKLLGDEQTREAVEIFKLNVEIYPNSSNAHDSLGEVYKTQGDRELSIRHYRRALELNPACRTSRTALEEWEGETKTGEE